MFDEGALVFQQKASAFPAVALDPPRGAQVIDACAATRHHGLGSLHLRSIRLSPTEAPGSKTSQMAVTWRSREALCYFYLRPSSKALASQVLATQIGSEFQLDMALPWCLGHSMTDGISKEKDEHPKAIDTLATDGHRWPQMATDGHRWPQIA
eukprot:Skav205858  [mRNA]  locus=scaffold766:112738:114688:+ [translate_table: standard]